MPVISVYCLCLAAGLLREKQVALKIRLISDQWLFAIGVEPIWKEREGPQQIRDPSNFEEILDYPWPWLRTFMFQHVALVTSH